MLSHGMPMLSQHFCTLAVVEYDNDFVAGWAERRCEPRVLVCGLLASAGLGMVVRQAVQCGLVECPLCESAFF